MPDLVTLGEAMAVVRATAVGPPRPGAAAQLSFAGAESTVAIGVRRLGHSARWIGRLGSDAFGDMILAALRAEDVAVDAVARDADRPTGLLVRHRRTADRAAVAYYRTGGAGAAVGPHDVPADVLPTARVLHLTGITPALGEQPRAAVEAIVAAARRARTRITFDVNYRRRLWSEVEARPVLRRLVAGSATVFAGAEEAALVLDRPEPVDAVQLARGLAELGPEEVVLKLGAAGALVLAGGDVARVPAVAVTAVDVVGAGDGFVAGYLSGLLDELPPAGRLARGAVCGAFAVSTTGDWEGLPTRAELGLLTGPDVVR
ncbi:sugar kinase [Micromonospora sp. NPDC049171]|uniref:sugar kinase n=1 Tax=Micromonospora sp. NPDC049171 TaxID=3155770 RepID=UPI0033EDA883